MEAFDAIIENGDRLGSFTLLLLFIIALLTGKIVIGSEAKEKDAALAKANEALAIANKELQDNKFELVRLQVERELLWRQTLPSTSVSNPQAKGE